MARLEKDNLNTFNTREKVEELQYMLNVGKHHFKYCAAWFTLSVSYSKL